MGAVRDGRLRSRNRRGNERFGDVRVIADPGVVRLLSNEGSRRVWPDPRDSLATQRSSRPSRALLVPSRRPHEPAAPLAGRRLRAIAARTQHVCQIAPRTNLGCAAPGSRFAGS